MEERYRFLFPCRASMTRLPIAPSTRAPVDRTVCSALVAQQRMIMIRRLSHAIAYVSFAVVGTVVAAPSAGAQNAQAPQATDSHTSGSWVVRCVREPSSLCELAQFSIDRNQNVKIASVEITYVADKDVYRGRFGVPLGVSFDRGFGLEIGAFRAANMKYSICESDGCYVTGVLPVELINAMKDRANEKGVMDVQMIDGRSFQIPILLNGFADGLE